MDPAGALDAQRGEEAESHQGRDGGDGEDQRVAQCVEEPRVLQQAPIIGEADEFSARQAVVGEAVVEVHQQRVEDEEREEQEERENQQISGARVAARLPLDPPPAQGAAISASSAFWAAFTASTADVLP
jgi:hypothetical protein